MTPAEIEALKALCEKSGLIEALDLAVGSIGPPYSLEYLKARQSICDVLARVPALLSALEEARANAVDHRVRLEEERTLKNVYEARAAESYQRGRDAAMADYAQARAAAESALEEARLERDAARSEWDVLRTSLYHRAEAAESRADALQKERDEAEGGMRVYERAAKIATAERDALQAESDALHQKFDAEHQRANDLQAEVDRLRRDLSNAQTVVAGEAKAKVEARARADAAWRAGVEAAARACDDWRSDRTVLASEALNEVAARIRALPPPSATPNEET